MVYLLITQWVGGKFLQTGLEVNYFPFQITKEKVYVDAKVTNHPSCTHGHKGLFGSLILKHVFMFVK